MENSYIKIGLKKMKVNHSRQLKGEVCEVNLGDHSKLEVGIDLGYTQVI